MSHQCQTTRSIASFRPTRYLSEHIHIIRTVRSAVNLSVTIKCRNSWLKGPQYDTKAEPSAQSPTKRLLRSADFSLSSVHRVRSPARPPMRVDACHHKEDRRFERYLRQAYNLRPFTCAQSTAGSKPMRNGNFHDRGAGAARSCLECRILFRKHSRWQSPRMDSHPARY